jgi:hypothetical protein
MERTAKLGAAVVAAAVASVSNGPLRGSGGSLGGRRRLGRGFIPAAALHGEEAGEAKDEVEESADTHLWQRK